jgi:hypothetical protein
MLVKLKETWRKSFGSSDIPGLNIQLIKEHCLFWLMLLALFTFIKVSSLLIFGAGLDISVLAFFGGLFLSISLKNMLHFPMGVAIAYICELLGTLG